MVRDPLAGNAEIQTGIDAIEATGAWMLHSLFLALLAEAQQAAGMLVEALESTAPSSSHADWRVLLGA